MEVLLVAYDYVLSVQKASNLMQHITNCKRRESKHGLQNKILSLLSRARNSSLALHTMNLCTRFQCENEALPVLFQLST